MCVIVYNYLSKKLKKLIILKKRLLLLNQRWRVY